MLIIGLGNSPKEYAHTYHNAGFLFLDWLAKEHAAVWKPNKKIPAEIAEISLSAPDGRQTTATLFKPAGFMNESGAAAQKIVSSLRNLNTSKELVIAHDDSDIELGKYKIVSAGSAAGHKGVRSIMDTLGKDAGFTRIRIGIRSINENTPRVKAGEFVLKKISKDHERVLAEVFKEIANDIAGGV